MYADAVEVHQINSLNGSGVQRTGNEGVRPCADKLLTLLKVIAWQQPANFALPSDHLVVMRDM